MTNITPQQFGTKWKNSSLKESAAYFDHFNELCELVGHEKPSDFDPDGTSFTFQKFAAKESGKPGFADVWFRERFGVEYKGKGDDLEAVYHQLLQYRDNLANPPLLIVSDFETIEVHTNFNDTVSEVFIVTVDDLIEGRPYARRKTTDGKIVGALLSPMEVLHACFYEPELLKPTQTTSDLTEEASKLFQSIADGLRGWHPSSDREIARYLSRLIFCMFSSDVGLLPKNIITQIIDNAPPQPNDAFANSLTSLFNTMRNGGSYGLHTIEYFDGGLFGDEIEPLQDDGAIRQQIKKADQLDWSQVEPSVFGTLFERIFNPDKRSQLGRHYTPREEIETLAKPVIMTPLQREWDELRSALAPALEPGTPDADKLESTKKSLQDFIDRLSNVKILDPACGSGNFLYVALSLLKGLEQSVVTFAANHGITGLEQHVHPRQLFGIEYDPYGFCQNSEHRVCLMLDPRSN